MLPHAAGPNHLHYARVITNPHVCLAEPFNLNREDGDYVSLGNPFYGDETNKQLLEDNVRAGHSSCP